MSGPLVAGAVTDDPKYDRRAAGTSSAEAGQMHFVTGVPPNTLGVNGDLACRLDGTHAGATVLYHKEAGAWVALGV